MRNETEQMNTITGDVRASAKTDLEVDSSKHSVPKSRDISSDNVRYKRQTTTIASSTEQSSNNKFTHGSDAEQTVASVTNHQLWPEMTPYENVDGKFVFTFDYPETWHVTAVINDTNVVTVELAPSTEGKNARSCVLRIKQTLQPIETERFERYQHDTYRTQLEREIADPLQFDKQTIAVSIITQEQSYQWTVVLPDDNGSYLAQLTTGHTDDTTGQIDDESSGCTEGLRKLGMLVLYSFRPKDTDTPVQ